MPTEIRKDLFVENACIAYVTKYLSFATVVSPLIGFRTFNKYPSITVKPPIPIIISVHT